MLSTPALRTDLIISRQGTGQDTTFVLKDPHSGRFFRLGAPQARLQFVAHLWHNLGGMAVLLSRKDIKDRLQASKVEAQGSNDPRFFVRTIYSIAEDLSSRAGIDPGQAPLVSGLVLQYAWPVFMTYERGDLQNAAVLLLDTWKNARQVAAGAARALEQKDRPSTQERVASNLVAYNSAVLETVTVANKALEIRTMLSQVRQHLRLSYDHLGQMFGVSGETARRWEQGKSQVPAKGESQVLKTYAALKRMLTLFVPQRLPGVVRREAEVFDGETALNWILRGKIDEVADRYEATLAYQG